MLKNDDCKIKKKHNKKIYDDFGDTLDSLYSIKEKCHKTFSYCIYCNNEHISDYRTNIKTGFDFITKFKLLFYIKNKHMYKNFDFNAFVKLKICSNEMKCVYREHITTYILLSSLYKKMKIKKNKLIIPLYYLHDNYNKFLNINNNILSINIQNISECFSENLKIKYIVGNLKKNKKKNDKINNIVPILENNTCEPIIYKFSENNLIYYVPTYHSEVYNKHKNISKSVIDLNNNDVMLILYEIWKSEYYYPPKLEFKLNNIQLEKKMFKKMKIANKTCYMITFVEPYKKTIKKIKKKIYINKNINKNINENETSKLIIKSKFGLYAYNRLMVKINNF